MYSLKTGYLHEEENYSDIVQYCFYFSRRQSELSFFTCSLVFLLSNAYSCIIGNILCLFCILGIILCLFVYFRYYAMFIHVY